MKRWYLFLQLLLIFILVRFLPAQSTMDAAKEAIKDKKWQEAQKILEELIEKDEDNTQAHFLLGECFVALKNYDEAVDEYEEAVDLAPDSALYYSRLGQALGMKAQKSSVIKKAFLAPKVKSAFERAVELDPTLINARINLANFYLRAPAIMGGDLEKAREQAQALIRMNNINGKFVLAAIYLKEDKADSTEMIYEEIENKVGNDPQYYGFYNNYGYFLLNQKQYDKAIDKFKKQVELAPDKANPYDSLGDAYRAAGKIEQAKQQYKKALQIDPNFEPSRNKLDKLENN